MSYFATRTVFMSLIVVNFLILKMFQVQPNEIFRVDKYEGSTASSPLHEQSSEGLNQEMLDYEKQFSNLDRKVKPSQSIFLISKCFQIAQTKFLVLY